MAFTWEELEKDWLAGDRLAAPSVAVVAAFNRLEGAFGRDWVSGCRKAVGAIPTLPVVIAGTILASLEGLAKADKLVQALGRNDPSAVAEATAIHLLRSARPGADVELYPEVAVGARVRQPDFRIRGDVQEGWTYVEVTRPDVSEEQEEITSLLRRLAAIAVAVKKGFALEVFLRRRPTESEAEVLAQRIPRFSRLDGQRSEPLPNGLGILTLNRSEPGVVVPLDHPGEPPCPRLGCAAMIGGIDEPRRHIAVRIAYADERAKQLLNDEAQQLPKEYPGLVMIDMNRAPGGFEAWEPLLRRCFQPTQRTRVGAVCLFMSEMQATEEGFAWFLQTKLLINPHARFPLATWLTEGLQTGRRPGLPQGKGP
jgi:hypothetical protein